MEQDADWLTWPQAAELVGCPIPTIDWYTRTGRIKKRPKVGTRPSLAKSSVEEFALWWRDRDVARMRRRQERAEKAARLERHRAHAERLGIRPTRMPNAQDTAMGWLTTIEAAELLGVSRESVMRLVADAGCRTERVGHRWWIDQADVRNLAAERSQWISFAAAATLVGCSKGAIKTAVSAGKIRRRVVHRSQPSLNTESVSTFAQLWATKKERRLQRRDNGPPADGEVWLDSTTTALVLGVSRSRVSQLALAERLPCTVRNGRRWFQRTHVEQAAAARSASSQA